MPTNNATYMNAYRKKHYAANKAKYFASAVARKRRLRLILDVYKSRPCADCGNQYPPCVMDFDHVRGVKAFNVGRGGITCSAERLEKELEKCDVVCANCHRVRTHKPR